MCTYYILCTTVILLPLCRTNLLTAFSFSPPSPPWCTVSWNEVYAADNLWESYWNNGFEVWSTYVYFCHISVMALFTLFEYLPIVDSMPISFTQRGFSTQKYKPEVNFESVKQHKNLIKELLNIMGSVMGLFPLHNWGFLNNYYKVNPTGQWVKHPGYRKRGLHYLRAFHFESIWNVFRHAKPISTHSAQG